MKRENVHVHVQFHVQFHVQVLLVHLQAHLTVHLHQKPQPQKNPSTNHLQRKPQQQPQKNPQPQEKPQENRHKSLKRVMPQSEGVLLPTSPTIAPVHCSGWKLPIGEEEMKFKVFTSTFKYRNGIDVIGVRANCTFIGYEDSDFNGDQMILPAEPFDRWVVLADSPDFEHMDEEIESLKCFCEGHHN